MAETAPRARKYLLLKEAASIVRVSERWLRSVVSGERGENKPRAIRMGNGYRLPTDDFFKWAEKQEDRWPSPKKGNGKCT